MLTFAGAKGGHSIPSAASRATCAGSGPGGRPLPSAAGRNGVNRGGAGRRFIGDTLGLACTVCLPALQWPDPEGTVGSPSPNAFASNSLSGGAVIRLTAGTTTSGSNIVTAPANGTPSCPHLEKSVTALARPTKIPA